MKQFFCFALIVLLVWATQGCKQSVTTPSFFSDSVSVTEAAAGRLLMDSSKWRNWWPGIQNAGAQSSPADCQVYIKELLTTGFNAVVYDGTDSAALQLLIRDNTRATAAAAFEWRINPLTAWNKKKLDTCVQRLHANMKNYFGNQQNIYGRIIKQELVTDTTLIAVKKSFGTEPGTPEVYGLIDAVRKYIQEKGGTTRSYPMLNVYQEAPNKYQVMVGVPTTKSLPGGSQFLLRQLVPGHILMTEVRGGPAAIKEAQRQMEIYISDHKKSSPAIPYQSLITDRRAQPDTAQWITRLYYPVFF